MHLDASRRGMRAMALALSLAALPLALAGPAAATSAGGGVATGSISFTGSGLPPAVGGGTPPAIAACAFTSFSLSGLATGAAVHTVLSGFAGDIFLTGGGGSSICETVAASTGTVTITASGVGPTRSELSCPSLYGTYQRVGTEVVLNLSGSCYVNRFPAGVVRFAAHAELTPEEPGQGVTTPVTRAWFVAEFSIVPV